MHRQPKQILVLRPFRDPDLGAREFQTLCESLSGLGDVVALKNPGERGAAGTLSGSCVRGPIARMQSWFWSSRRAATVRFVPIDQAQWEKTIHELMRQVNAIVVHLRDRHPHLEWPKDREPGWIPLAPTGSRAVTGLSDGLLQELMMLHTANVLRRVVVLISAEVIGPIHSVEEIEAVGDGCVRKLSRRRLLEMMQEELDTSLRILRGVKWVVPYRRFGERGFRLCLRGALRDVLKYNAVSSEPVILGEPLALPPDNRRKRIRFSPVESLRVIPKGEIVEVSMDEAGEALGYPVPVNLTCPGCGAGRENMLWYQYGLEPKLDDAGVYMRCQFCGNDEYLEHL